ncbi:hypothetical protein EVC26_070 [Rhizobium phage RHph_I72]|nr:hypothetical protein EVC13_068 [Rhizobium phage RHph_I65]QIG76516.1 hypothetical protein EVC26_070 [Rhizobium phage RHph_I72]
MSAGQIISEAHDNAARALGKLSLMITQKKISRSTLERAAAEFEAAAIAIRSVLTPSAGGPTVGNSTEKET